MPVVDRVREALEADPRVRLAYVFGSVARGESRAASDVDVGVRVEPGSSLDALKEHLERVTGRAVDVVALRRAPPLLLHEIVRDGIAIVCRDEDERAEFESRALAEYLDTQHLRDVQHAYLHERMEQRRGPSR